MERYASVRLKPQRPERIGHPWVFAGEISYIPAGVADGDIVVVQDSTGHALGNAYVNRASKITLRYLSRELTHIDEQWWYDMLARATRRRAMLRHADRTDALRLVNAESDGLPGLIVDQYADVLAVQFLALGLESWRDVLVDALLDLVRPQTIWERSDVPVRELEGLERRTGLLAGREPPDRVEVYEGRARLLVDIRSGQKTGMFLDQRRNRAAVANYAGDAAVLNCFAYSGAFGVHAGLSGARHVINADISAAACALAERNMALNGLAGRSEAIEANCFDLLRDMSDGSVRFEMVILDPPAFTKSRDTVESALARLQRDQSARHATARAGRHSGHLFVLAACRRRELQGHAPERCT